MQGVENVGREGIGTLSDYVQGTRSTLADIGRNPGSLFEVKKGGNLLKGELPISFPGATKAAGALAPTIALGTGDVAYEAAIDAQNLFDETEAEELKQFYRDRYDYKGPGDVKMQEDIKEKVVMEAKDGGLMNLGGKEMDLRKGGFVPIGKKERADDVPARLSKNEFVMTADAVRAAGGGSVNKGAKRMYETMNKLEARA